MPDSVSGENCEQPEEASICSIYVRKLAHPGTLVGQAFRKLSLSGVNLFFFMCKIFEESLFYS